MIRAIWTEQGSPFPAHKDFDDLGDAHRFALAKSTELRDEVEVHTHHSHSTFRGWLIADRENQWPSRVHSAGSGPAGAESEGDA